MCALPAILAGKVFDGHRCCRAQPRLNDRWQRLQRGECSYPDLRRVTNIGWRRVRSLTLGPCFFVEAWWRRLKAPECNPLQAEFLQVTHRATVFDRHQCAQRALPARHPCVWLYDDAGAPAVWSDLEEPTRRCTARTTWSQRVRQGWRTIALEQLTHVEARGLRTLWILGLFMQSRSVSSPGIGPA